MTDVLRPLPVERRFPLACTRVAVTTEARGQGGRFAEAEFHEPIARRRLTPSRMPKSPRSMPDQEPTSATGGSVLSRRNWVRLIPALTLRTQRQTTAARQTKNTTNIAAAPQTRARPCYQVELWHQLDLPPNLRTFTPPLTPHRHSGHRSTSHGTKRARSFWRL